MRSKLSAGIAPKNIRGMIMRGLGKKAIKPMARPMIVTRRKLAK